MFTHRRGICAVYASRLPFDTSRVKGCRLMNIMATIDAGDLIDAHGVAKILGLSHSNSVSTYQRRYPDMPRPAVDLGEGRCKLWLRSDVMTWDALRRVGHAEDAR